MARLSVFEIKTFLLAAANSKCFQPIQLAKMRKLSAPSRQPQLGRTVLVMHITVPTDLCLFQEGKSDYFGQLIVTPEMERRIINHLGWIEFLQNN